MADEFLGKLGSELGEVGALTSKEPVLVAALAPAFEVVVVEVFTFGAESGDDGVVSKTVQEHVIDSVAEFLGKMSDFAGAGFTWAPGGVWENAAPGRGGRHVRLQVKG